jgi:hypothetical protein
MTAAFLDFGIREAFFFAVRLFLAVGAWFVGYFASGPLVWLVARAVLRRDPPGWVMAWGKVLSGFVVALLVFFLLPLGWDGGTGGGSGGGTGKGKGTGKDGSGAGAATSPGTGKIGPTDKGGPTDKRVRIDMIEEGQLQGDRCFRVLPDGAALNWKELEAYLDAHRDGIDTVEVIIHPRSASENDPQVLAVRNWANQHKKTWAPVISGK